MLDSCLNLTQQNHLFMIPNVGKENVEGTVNRS